MSPRLLPAFPDMLDRLFAAPSVSSMIPAHDRSNRPIVEVLAEWAGAIGCEVSVQAIPGYPGKFNLVATLGKGPGGLILAGHTDTVPWDEGLWRHDPFRATFTDDRVYGLGASDMKGFLAVALEVMGEVDPSRLRAPVILVATADEESTMSGARALAAAGTPKARHALIGEPTGLRPVRAHKGIMMESLKVVGRSGHSSDPGLGHNAIEGMQRVLDALARWRAALQAEFRDPAFRVPFPTMNFGHIHGGDNPNRICPYCELQLDLRPIPGMSLESLRTELRAQARNALTGTPYTLECTELFGGVSPMLTAADAAIVAIAERLTGHAAESVAFATEGPYFAELGAETVVLGPGDIAQAHQPDEFLLLDRVEPMRRILRGLIGALCVEAA